MFFFFNHFIRYFCCLAIALSLNLVWGCSQPPALADAFNCFQAGNCTPPALSNSATCLVNRDYTVTVTNVSSPVTVLSFHGGRIERHTSEISAKLQQLNHWNRYDLQAHGTETCLAGQSNFQRLHITSTRFDDPVAVNLVSQFPNAVAIHGYNRPYPQGMICVGGANAAQVQAFMDQVNQRKSLFPNYDLLPINAPQLTNPDENCFDLKGISTKNIVNRTSTGQGLQLELSQQLRADLVNPSPSYDSLRRIIYEAIAQAMKD
ncbi:MAG: poly-gamma-glutamate hydrolase family protein [Snowella sp.]|nr:poly-gamma-glutamate hydrolase family protein [Snowella sp.]